MTEMAFGAVATIESEPVLPQWWRTVDRWTLAAVFVLFGIGLLMALAASGPLAVHNGLDPLFYFRRQGMFGAIALMVMIWLSMRSPKTIRRLAVVGFFGAFVALALLPWLGVDFGKGANRWYSLGFLTVQPAEFIKPVFAVFAAWLLAASTDLGGPPGKTISFGFMVAIVLQLALQPDFGQAALVLACWGLMYFVAGAPKTLIFAISGLVIAAGMFAYRNSAHVAGRINDFLSPEVDPRTQMGFVTNAIQEGGFFGVGVGQGQVKWSLPDAHSDFIIAVAAEEFGLFFCLFIVAVFLFITMRSLLRLRRERDIFVRLAGVGLASLMGMQAFINLGVAVRLLPAKGMTLPFVSYGGSSLLAAAAMMGMLLALTRRRPQADMGDVFGRDD